MKLIFLISIIAIMLFTQIFGTYLAIPSGESNIEPAFGDPNNNENAVTYLLLVIVMTAVILGIYKLGWGKAVTAFIYFGAWSITFVVINTLIMKLVPTISSPIGEILLFGIPTICVILLWKFPEWYVVDGVGIFMCSGVSAVVGISFGIVPVLLLLVLFAVYDGIAVYKTKHMQKLAENVLTNKLPSLFIIPPSKDFSYREEKVWTDLDDRGKRDAYILGMGDIIIPSSLVVSASIFLAGTKIWLFTLPAIGAMIGSVVGLIALQVLADRYPTSHAGLPVLNSFSIIGFLAIYVPWYLIK